MVKRFLKKPTQVMLRSICGAVAAVTLSIILTGCLPRNRVDTLYNVKWVSSEPEIEFYGTIRRSLTNVGFPPSYYGHIVVGGERISIVFSWRVGGLAFNIYLPDESGDIIQESKLSGKDKYYHDERKVVIYDISYDEWFDYRYSEIALYAVDLTPAEREECGLDP